MHNKNTKQQGNKKAYSLPLSTSVSRSRGFVAVFAMLIATVILVMVISITGTAYKETMLSASVRESERAFYAADTGVECGLYLDRIAGGVFVSGGVTDTMCGDIAVDVDVDGLGSVYNFDIPISSNSCAKVDVFKNLLIDGASFTQVVSRGYNTSCDDLLDLGNRRVVERKLDVRYANPIVFVPTGGGEGAPTDETGTGGEAL